MRLLGAGVVVNMARLFQGGLKIWADTFASSLSLVNPALHSFRNRR